MQRHFGFDSLRRLRRYLPFGLGGEYNEQQQPVDEEDEQESSADAPALFSDDGETSSPTGGGGDFSSARSSFRLKRRNSSGDRQRSPSKGKFLKRSETAPRPSSASGVGMRLAEKHRRRPTSEQGDAPNSSATENLTSRLSRRSSIISDLVALMVRRHSRQPETEEEHERIHDEEEEEEDEEDEGGEAMGSRERILQKIRHHKEIIGKVRLQPWPMRRKRRALKVARQYLQRQEARVSRWNLYRVELSRRVNQAWRWAKNLSIYLIPWESKIKQIESNFGSVVSSYFIFLRWVLGINVTTSLLMMMFVVVPEWLADSQNDAQRLNRTRHIKMLPAKDVGSADELNTVLDFGGYLEYSYLFYGFYSSETVLKGIIPYNVPVAYLCVNLFLLVFCIFIILKKMTSNTRKSKLSSGKQEQYVFTWKVINGWDYNLGESDTASSLAMANVIKLKEASTEYNKKFKQKWTCKTFILRLFVNVAIMSMIGVSMLAIWMVAQITEKDTFIKQNAVSITVALITLLFPPIFELILKLEQYRPRTALRIHLLRVLIFYLINYFTLVAGLFTQLNKLEAEMRANELSEQWAAAAAQQSPTPGYFHIVHSPQSNRTYYEVVTADGQRRPFVLFASISAERRREKRQFLHARRGPNIRPAMGRRRKKRPTPAPDGKGAANVVYSLQPLPGHPTAAPHTTQRPWTTIQPHFGPFIVGVQNPKAIVVAAPAGHVPAETVYESRVIGPAGDWATTEAPIPLNYTSAPRPQGIGIKMPFRVRYYDDLCWETRIGQEIAKIVTTDLVMTVAAILVIDFLRGLWIRYCSDWWCWDIESTFPEYGEFKVAENVLHLVNSQGMVCLGTILVPMLPLINCVKLVLMMYIRAWACMVCNVPAKQIFRASRSSNFYFWLLLMMLCISTLPVGFVIASKKPSKNCGPFAGQERFYSVIGVLLQQNLNKGVVDVISYLMSPGIVIPVLLLMFLIIYFLVLLVNGLRAANTDLNKQLTLERTEEKRKIFELAKGKRAGISHGYKPSGESCRRAGNGAGGHDDEQPPPRNGAMELFQKARERMSPLYFLNGAAKSALRKSWHGGGSEREPEGILLNPLLPQKKPTPLYGRQYSDESNGSGSMSPSKSPLRQPSFLPSLQSVHENEDEEDGERTATSATGTDEPPRGAHTEAWIAAARRQLSIDDTLGGIAGFGAAGSVEERRGSRSTAQSQQQPRMGTPPPFVLSAPVRFSWRDRLLICIGWTDPGTVERRMRRQMADAEMERGGGGRQALSAEESPLLRRRRRSAGTGTAEKPAAREQQPVPALEEADYSVPSDAEEREEAAEKSSAESSSRSAGETVLLVPSPQQGDNTVTASSPASTVQPMHLRTNRLAELDERGMSTSGASSGTSARTGSQRSWVRQPTSPPIAALASPPPAFGKGRSPSPLLLSYQTPPAIKRVHSSPNGGRGRIGPVPEREHVSESSPLSQRAQPCSPFSPTSERGGDQWSSLSPDKRSPMSPKAAARALGYLPPLAPKTGALMSPEWGSASRRRGSRDSRTLRLDAERQDSEAGDADAGSLATRAPSAESFSLLDQPPTPTGHFRPITAILGDSFVSTGSDPRLQYANPYSSYAAAMCSPLLLPSEELELPPPMSPMQQLPQRSTPVLPSPQLQRRIPSPGAQYSPAHRPSPMRSAAPTPPRHGRSPFEYIPPTTTTTPIAPPDAKGVSPVAFSSGYETPIVERRGGTAASRPEPIYDQPIEQRRPSTSTMYGGGAGTLGAGQTTGDEGGSTSGRGTMPPGYGSSPGSSPEFGRPKYRISSMSPGGRSRRDQRQQGTDSSPDSGGVQRRQRQFDIRQRSAMGQGHPLLRRLPSSEGQGEEKQSFV